MILNQIEVKPFRIPIMHRLKLWIRNCPSWPTAHAYWQLKRSLKSDPMYAHAWKCNIAMPIYDNCKGKLTIVECNEIADRLMKHIFSVDTSQK